MQLARPDWTLATAPSLPRRIFSPRIELGALAKIISRFERQPVIGKTGLPGYYAIHLTYAPDPLKAAPPGADAAAATTDDPRALTQFLGLASKVPSGY